MDYYAIGCYYSTS